MASKSKAIKSSPMSKSITKIIIVRHGETDWNVIHRLQGVTDTHLTDLGVKQAKCAAQRLAKWNDEIAQIYSSNLSRALNTAKEMAKARSLDETGSIIIDERLREFDSGIFSGHTAAEARKKFAKEWAEHIENDDYVIPQGESYTQFIQRTTSALHEIRNRHEGETVCIVTHGGVIDCAKTYLATSSIVDGRSGNASINEFHAHPDGTWTISKWNDLSHLASLNKKVLLADDVVQHASSSSSSAVARRRSISSSSASSNNNN